MSNFNDRFNRDNLIGGIILFLTFPIWGQIAFLVFYYPALGLIGLILNDTTVWNSEFIGENVTLAPFAIVTKMKSYGGWRDRYYYVFAKNPEALNQKSINEIRYYKVTSEKRNIGSSERVCILENAKLKEQKISIDCDYISKINALATIYNKLKNDIKLEGKAYVSSWDGSDLKPFLEVDRFSIYEVKNEEEIKKVMVSDDNRTEPYEYVLDSKHLVYVRKDLLNNKNLLLQLLSEKIRGK